MGIKEPSFTLGVEEEYLLVDKETRSLVIDPPDSLTIMGSLPSPRLLIRSHPGPTRSILKRTDTTS